MENLSQISFSNTLIHMCGIVLCFLTNQVTIYCVQLLKVKLSEPEKNFFGNDFGTLKAYTF